MIDELVFVLPDVRHLPRRVQPDVAPVDPFSSHPGARLARLLDRLRSRLTVEAADAAASERSDVINMVSDWWIASDPSSVRQARLRPEGADRYSTLPIRVWTPAAAVTITSNTVTGEGPITYIAQNGIQVSFGATAKLVGNDVSLNNYTPPKVTACGLLIFKARRSGRLQDRSLVH